MPEGHKETLQLIFIPQVLAWYIHYQQIYTNNIYLLKYEIPKYIFPHPVPEGHKETLQLTFIPQVLAWYIHYQGIYSTDLYFPNCWYHIWILVYHSNFHLYPKKLQHLYNTYIYIVFKFFIPSVFKNITYVDLCVLKLYLCLSVYVYLCICNFRHP